MRTFRIGEQDITVSWAFLKTDGTPFSLSAYDYDLYYITGRGNNLAIQTQLLGDNKNVVVWTLPAEEQTISGIYDLRIYIRKNELDVCDILYREAFALSEVSQDDDNNIEAGTESTNLSTTPEVISITTTSQFYMNEASIPTIGANGNWYINGKDTGVSAHTSITCKEDGTIVFDEGKSSESSYYGIKNIVSHFENLPLRIFFDTNGDSFLAYGESLNLSCKVMRGYEEVTSRITSWSIVRDSGDALEDAAWLLKSKVQNFTGTIQICNTASENDLGTNTSRVSTRFTVSAIMVESGAVTGSASGNLDI